MILSTGFHARELFVDLACDLSAGITTRLTEQHVERAPEAAGLFSADLLEATGTS